MERKVLIVTDYAGNLHITPTGNKPYYQGRNKIVKGKQFKFREGMTDEEARAFVLKNKGTDPDHQANVAQAVTVIAGKDAEIAALKEQLAALQNGTATDILGKVEGALAGSAFSIAPDLAAAAQAVKYDLNADDTIAKIKAAVSLPELDVLVIGEGRKSVLEAAAKKAEQLAATPAQ